MKTQINNFQHVKLITGLIGGSPNSFDTKSFDTIEQAKKHWHKEYVNRKKKQVHTLLE